MNKKIPFAAGVLALSAFALPMAAPATEPEKSEGQKVFETRCLSCHAIKPGVRSFVGPNLNGIIGRKAASTEFRYTPALMKSGIVWSTETLDEYVKAPMKAVPGTRMAVGLADDAKRAAVIEYIASTGDENEN